MNGGSPYDSPAMNLRNGGSVEDRIASPARCAVSAGLVMSNANPSHLFWKHVSRVRQWYASGGWWWWLSGCVVVVWWLCGGCVVYVVGGGWVVVGEWVVVNGCWVAGMGGGGYMVAGSP